MSSEELPTVQPIADESWLKSTGSRVTVSDFHRWTKDAALPAPLAGVLDGVRKQMAIMGFPISARGYRAICRFVASSEPVVSAETAMDLQLTQRVLSRVRNLVTQQQYDALDALERTLSRNDICSFDYSLACIAQLRATETAVDIGI